MPELRILMQGSPEQTQVFVGSQRVSLVQKITVSPGEVQIYFPMPSLHPDRRAQIEKNMALVKGLPGVIVGHIVTGDCRTLGKSKGPKKTKKQKSVQFDRGKNDPIKGEVPPRT